MKPASTIILILALSASCFGIAQSANMKDMKGMDMKGMGSKPNANGSEADTHKTTAVVKGIDTANGKVKLARFAAQPCLVMTDTMNRATV